MRKAFARIGFAVLAVLLIAFIALRTWEPFAATRGAPPPARHYAAEIVRDAYGVPHIHGHRDVDVAFGIAMAHAEDDFSTLQDVVAMTRGRYGAIAGQDGAAVDFAYHLLDARGTAERHYAELPADVRALVEAYATGLNTYARRHPGEVKLDRLFPVDGVDIATGFALRQPFFFGLDKTLGALAKGEPAPVDFGPVFDKTAPGNPPADRDLVLPSPTGRGSRGGGAGPQGLASIAGAVHPHPTLPLKGEENPSGDDNGSNAFAIAPAKSGDGTTRLVSNAHQPWRGPVAWYELEVESDEGWHYAGATFPGAPFPLLGHNESLGWTNTVNRPDLVDVYRLVLDESGTKYRLDGKWLPLVREDVVLPVKFGPVILPIRRSVWRSAHGPVIVNANGAFAIRYGGMDRIDQLTEYYRLNKARDYAEWRAALSRQAIPSTNFVYADAAGNIAYQYNAAIPERPPGHDWRRVLPGDRSDLIWHSLVPFERIPHYFDPASGYLYNSNNSPFHASGPSDLAPASVPPEWGVELTMTNRARRAQKLFAEPGPIGLRRLEAIKYDLGWERAGYVARLLDGIAKLDLRGDPELAKAQALLGRWDFTSDGKGAADALALLVLHDATSADYNNRPDPDPKTELRQAADHLTHYFHRLDPPMGEVLRLRQGPGKYAVDLPYFGGSDTLRAASNWDVAADGRLSVKHGDSFVMFMEWDKDGKVHSTSAMPFGSATTRPGSPHYTDQSRLFVAMRRKPVHFERADVLRNAVRRYDVTSD
ncbi:MAG: penicillin acylase family protein [Novosphingobium sp.]|nr:penicillin acylase family protein [Novosphingobium sp.]MBO9601688.1 penicillin acylase family protein [Novosphingobium sp.]